MNGHVFGNQAEKALARTLAVSTLPKLYKDDPVDTGPCEPFEDMGRHLGYKVNHEYGSIVTCKCCEDRNGPPRGKERCSIEGHYNDPPW